MDDNSIPQQGQAGSGKTVFTSEELIAKLRQALLRNGDFPASAKIVGELRQLISDPKVTANQVTEVILREPSLGIRVLHLVNSSFYRRAKPIMTVSQAVVQIGMRPLAEMCSGLVLLQRFVPAARRGGSFANCLRKTVLTSLLASSISPATNGAANRSRNEEHGYLAGSFAELGTLLLAFYFPQIYESAVKRSELKKNAVAQSIKEITGLSPLQLSMEVIDALDLPAFYKEILQEQEMLEKEGINASRQTSTNMLPDQSAESRRIAKAVSAAKCISEVVSNSKSRSDLDGAINQVKNRYGIEAPTLSKVVADLPKIFKDHCSAIDLQLPALPEFVMTFSQTDSEVTASTADKSGATQSTSSNATENQFNQFVSEIKQAVESREPTASIITSVMETLAWGLKFDRVFLMLVNNNKVKLCGRMLLGNYPGFDPRKFERALSGESATNRPELVAFKQSRPVYNGDPLLKNGWPLVAIPIGFGQRAIGVIYADRCAEEVQELGPQEQAAIGILAELLDRSLALQ